ncbi:MAG: asparagine synthase (glutamine-hydrolyzing) [Candidatus Omnitrophica bacterium]|nr:asparagine synthase (glutamine-hydrolyzing) [Candidatus Omnitrophota bacterium]
MSGIVGVLDFKNNPVSVQLIKRMADTIKHRGPDGEGLYTNKNIGLGHRRLNVLTYGYQPLCNEDESVWIVCDGEIYNSDQLKEECEKKGHKFKSKSKAEPIVHLYEEKGAECVKYLRGMFSFAIWDNKISRLFLARDRIGQKPLCYFFDDRKIIFGSEIKSILEDKDVDRKVNIESLHDYLTLGYTPAPNTMFKGISKLPPGHILLCQKGKVKIERYWSLNYAEKEKMSLQEYEERILDLLREAVKVRLIEGTSPCAFLSGGTDSSAIVAMMSQLGRAGIKTFSIGLQEKDFSELKFAREVSRLYGTEHQEYIVRPDDVIKTLPHLVWYYNEPFGDSSCIPTYYASKMAAKFTRFVLTGDGGDECFGGYERFMGLNLSRFIDRFPKSFYRFSTAFLGAIESKSSGRKSDFQKINRFLEAVSKYRDPVKRYQRWISYFDDEQKDLLYTDTMKESVADKDTFDYFKKVFSEAQGKNFMDRILYLEFKTGFPGDSLVKIDIAGMANSLQLRSPFLDPPLMEFAARIPVNLKLKNFTTKYIFKRALLEILPKQIIYRRKMGFGIPIGKWFRNEMKEFVQDILLDNVLSNRGYFKKDAIAAMLEEHISGRLDHTFRIWALLNFKLWHRRFIDNN